jgi:hypothetical protein
MTRGRVVVALALTLALGAARPAAASHAMVPTHATLLDSVAALVAVDLTSGVALPTDRAVAIRSPVPGDTLGLVTRHLLEQLRAEKVEVRLATSGTSPGRAPGSDDAADADSLPTSGSASGPTASALQLDVQVDASEVMYVKRVGKFPFGTKGYERLAAIRANATLLDPRTGDVSWTRSSNRSLEDLVPKGDVAYAASGSGKLNPTTPRGSGVHWLEPLIVVGVVAGLVVLFYSNRN